MADSADNDLSDLLRERLRIDAEIARYQQAITVLLVDIVGSTRFYERYGDVAGLAMVQRFLDRLLPIVEARGGTVVKTIGDAILARFKTAFEGVHCALDMQRSLMEYNGARPAAEQIHIRVALNCGFALIKGTDVFGDVVNVCSRMESTARPDDILMSASVYDQICQHQEIAVRKRGDGVQLKGKAEKLDLYEVVWRFGEPVGLAPPRPSESQIALAALPQPAETQVIAAVEPPQTGGPVSSRRIWLRVSFIAAALAVIAIAVAVAFWLRRGERRSPGVATEASAPSIAVLPFVDMSSGKDQEYFSDGLAEELLNSLARIAELRVTARTSSFQFKGKNEDLRAVGEKLSVGAILEGSVRKEGQRVRITAQLIKTADGFHLWSQTYERELNDIFAVQEEIADSVANALKLKLLGSKPIIPSSRAKNTEAYNAYLQGRYFYEQRGDRDLEKAIGYYEQAIKLDPNYAPAWAGLAISHSVQADSGEVPVEEGYREARKAAERALALDPNLAEAHVAMGNIKSMHDWNWMGADASYQRALVLEPGNVRVIAASAAQAAILGRFEKALAFDRRAIELDPLRPASWYGLAMDAYCAGRLDEAVASLRKYLELAPNRPQGHYMLGRVYLAQLLLQEALAEMEHEPVAAFRLQGQALAYHALGRKKEADAVLREYIARHHAGGAYQIAELYAFRGEADRAFEWLENAYAQRDSGLTQMKGNPLLKSLESDPRYAAFLKKMHLPL